MSSFDGLNLLCNLALEDPSSNNGASPQVSEREQLEAQIEAIEKQRAKIQTTIDCLRISRDTDPDLYPILANCYQQIPTSSEEKEALRSQINRCSAGIADLETRIAREVAKISKLDVQLKELRLRHQALLRK